MLTVGWEHWRPLHAEDARQKMEDFGDRIDTVKRDLRMREVFFYQQADPQHRSDGIPIRVAMTYTMHMIGLSKKFSGQRDFVCFYRHGVVRGTGAYACPILSFNALLLRACRTIMWQLFVCFL